MATRKKKVSINTRVDEHPGVFREDGGIMFCNFCDLSVEWKSKSTVDGHCLSKEHIKKRHIYKINNSEDVYAIFRSAFNVAYNKFVAHIPQHPARSLFRACRVFDPLYIKMGIQHRNIRQYSAIIELSNPSDELLREWSIYCGLVNEIIEEYIDLLFT